MTANDHKHEIDWNTEDPLERAQLYVFERQYDLAEEEYQDFLKENPGNEHAYFGLARLYFTLLNIKKAKELTNEGLGHNPESAKLHSAMAALHLNVDELEQGKEWLAKAEALDPDEYHVLFTKGRVALLEKRYAEAEELFKKASEKADAFSVAYSYIQLGIVYADQTTGGGKPEMLAAAENAFLRAIEVNPRWESGYCLALQYLRLHPDPEVPLAIAERALAEFPESAAVGFLALRPLILAERFDDAEYVVSELMEELINDVPNLIKIADVIGEFPQFNNYREEVLAHAEHNNPNTLLVAQNFVKLYEATGDELKLAKWKEAVQTRSSTDD